MKQPERLPFTGKLPPRFKSTAEENAYIALAKAGNLEAEKRIMVTHIPFVIQTASRYYPGHYEIGDYVSAGHRGLRRAIYKFEPSRDKRFLTYAVWWIRQAISKMIMDTGREIRIPHNRILKAKKAEKSLHRQQITQAEYEEMLSNLTPTTIGIESKIDGDYQSLSDILVGEDPREDHHPEAGIWERAAEFLTSEEYRLLWLRYGEDLTLQAVGEIYGLTRERIRQKVAKVLAKLKRRKKQIGEIA